MNSKSSKFMPSLSREHVKKFIDSFDTVLTDCDGVLWVENNAIDGSPALIRRLVDLGKKVFYVTNNSTRNRQDYVEKCRKLGFPAEKPDVMPEVWSTLRSVEGDIENHLDGEVGAVVVGFDPHFSYPKLIKAASYLSNPDCLYIATNTDERFPVNSRLVYPGTGSLVAAVTACSARSPLVLGKPNPYVADAIAKFHTLDPQRTLMIGDRGNTDILLGTKCGFQTLLVMTGVTSKEELAQWQCSENAEERSLVPDYYVNKLGDLIQFL
ncbi:glycerol-3-phosphate phosphatase isoform X2 [Ischnura elegans]|uniref:glycerol-3-phosphate phosphatase isoform X2 n=1 Tax=Ischnura elegans TaxID=197161 RepID=UPI001ED893F6|nr:glycerol-3-phosphate phosphatase isoform X2 [Ischnura elegans]